MVWKTDFKSFSLEILIGIAWISSSLSESSRRWLSSCFSSVLVTSDFVSGKIFKSDNLFLEFSRFFKASSLSVPVISWAS